MRVCLKSWSSLTALCLLFATACTEAEVATTTAQATSVRQSAETDLPVIVDGNQSEHEKLAAELDGKPASLEEVAKVLGDETAGGKEILADTGKGMLPVEGAASKLSTQVLLFEGLSKTLDAATDNVEVCSTFPVNETLIRMCVLLPPAKAEKAEEPAMAEARAQAEQMSTLMDELAKRYPDPEKVDRDALVKQEAESLEKIATLYCKASGLEVPCNPSQGEGGKTLNVRQTLAPWWQWLTDAVSRVGVIPNGGDCPASYPLVQIYHDDEDRRNANSHWGWLGGISQNSNTLFRFCKVPGYLFHSLVPQGAQYNYAVLRLGLFCPGGTARGTVRHFDNEDSNNQNWISGGAFPNVNLLGKNQVMFFCVMQGGPNSFPMSGFPNLGFSYGVLAPTNLAYSLQSGHLYKDDEDFLNTNFWLDGPSNMMGDGNNTWMDLARVK